jgi:hypothetical protein
MQDGSAPAEAGALSFPADALSRSPESPLRLHRAGAPWADAMGLRGLRGRGPVVARFRHADARKRKVLTNLAWTSLVWRRKIWHGPLGQ